MQPPRHTTTAVQAPAETPGVTPPAGAKPGPHPGHGLEARMAAVKEDMDARLALAAIAYEVNAAHIETPPVDWSDIAAPPTPITPGTPTPPAPTPTPYATPVAALLHRASLRLREGGWCAGALTDEEGRLCSQGAIRRESRGDRDLEAQAMNVLLEAIRRRFGPHVESVPSFNDAWANGREPTRMLEQASILADARGI
ncbi:hypothetical protein OHB05_00725 [Streptomyces sp. NBC_00638]|uniref:DUF6197 family protein n=1 Tax=unclassified Streptomyces TaxID=2593676 RepID=UPI002253A384|nr:hypothetical protein [Streptomyces sp. NBC_00638]MCX5001155.1 hypothetical protein [Streptomyces sp. NBC_00638]